MFQNVNNSWRSILMEADCKMRNPTCAEMEQMEVWFLATPVRAFCACVCVCECQLILGCGQGLG